MSEKQNELKIVKEFECGKITGRCLERYNAKADRTFREVEIFQPYEWGGQIRPGRRFSLRDLSDAINCIKLCSGYFREIEEKNAENSARPERQIIQADSDFKEAMKSVNVDTDEIPF